MLNKTEERLLVLKSKIERLNVSLKIAEDEFRLLTKHCPHTKYSTHVRDGANRTTIRYYLCDICGTSV